MKLTVHVKPNARKAMLEVLSPREVRVWVSAPPTEGKANKQLIELLAEHFGVPKSAVEIKTGAGSRTKIVEIADSK